MLMLRNSIIDANRGFLLRNAFTVVARTNSSTAVTVSEESQRPILSKNHRGYSEDGGLVYTGFTYYPRSSTYKDPPYEPSKALMVEKIRCLKKKPYWQKDIMKEIGLDGKRSEIAILANTSATCAKLWKVKNLIRITPITLPQGLPEDGDFTGARLQENGQLTFIPKLGASSTTADTLLSDKIKSRPDFMDGNTLRKHLRLKWLKPMM